MLPDHFRIDPQTESFHCERCGAAEAVPSPITLASLDKIISELMARHQDCVRVAVPRPIRHAGCWNQPRPSKDTWYMGQDGWTYSEDGHTRTPVMVKIYHVMSTDCRYDRPDKDADCAGCVHMNVPLVLESSVNC